MPSHEAAEIATHALSVPPHAGEGVLCARAHSMVFRGGTHHGADASGFEQHLSRLTGEGKIACKMRGGNSDYRNYPLGKVPKYMLLKGINRTCINRLRVMHGVDHII